MRAASTCWLFPIGALLAACAACAPTDDPGAALVFAPCATRVIPAAGSSESEVSSIGDALALWTAAGLAWTAPEAASGDPSAATDELEVRFESAAEAFHGVYDDERGCVYVNRRLSGAARVVTLAHELGHAFGLAHTTSADGRSVMAPGNTSTPPLEADVARLEALWAEACAPATAGP